MGAIGQYRRNLLEAKRSYPHQSLTFKLFRQVYAFTSNKFYWDSQFIFLGPLLWYRASQLCVVDIPFWKSLLFRWYMKREDRRNNAVATRQLISKNNSTLMLTDIQATIQQQLDSNEAMIRRELANLRQQSARLTPFQEDYVKTKIEVEV